MVAAGLVPSLARPGGNATGLSLLSSDLDGKRLDLLVEVMPGARRMAALADPATTSPQHLQMLIEAARAHGIELLIVEAKRPDEIAVSIEMAKRSDVAALNLLSSAMLYVNQQVVLKSAATLGLPTIYPWPEASDAGGLIAYGWRIVQIYRDIFARQAVKLLRGAKPADLPVEQPTTFELAVNLKTAKTLGLTIPEAFLLRADSVIE